MGNTVLSLSTLQKYDNRPCIVCIVSTKKISPSSQELSMNNIKGSFNGSDIINKLDEIENEPKKFEKLYAIHQGLTFEDNLQRLVEITNGIIGRDDKFEVTENDKTKIISYIDVSKKFIVSSEYIA